MKAHFEHRAKPNTFNATSKTSIWSTAAEIATWREAMAWVAKAHRPRVSYEGPVKITVHHFRESEKDRPVDVGAVFIAAKGGIDGLVDAGVLDDDGPDIVRELIFLAPEVVGYHGLGLTVEDIS